MTNNILIITYILNIIDYAFTSYWVSKYGIDVELNPIGRWMLTHNVAFAVKIFAVGAIMIALGYLYSLKPNIAWTVYIPFVIYAILTIYHIVLIFF